MGKTDGGGEAADEEFVRGVGVGVHEDDGEGAIALCVEVLEGGFYGGFVYVS